MCLRGWDEATPNVFYGLAAQSHSAWSLRMVVDSEWDPAWPAARAAVASSAAAGATWRAAAVEVLRDRCARRRARCAAPGLGPCPRACAPAAGPACRCALCRFKNFAPRSEMARPRRSYGCARPPARPPARYRWRTPPRRSPPANGHRCFPIIGVCGSCCSGLRHACQHSMHTHAIYVRPPSMVCTCARRRRGILVVAHVRAPLPTPTTSRAHASSRAAPRGRLQAHTTPPGGGCGTRASRGNKLCPGILYV